MHCKTSNFLVIDVEIVETKADFLALFNFVQDDFF